MRGKTEMMAAETRLNAENFDLTGLAGTGLPYQ